MRSPFRLLSPILSLSHIRYKRKVTRCDATMVAATQAYTVSQLLKKYPGSHKGANSAIAQMLGNRILPRRVLELGVDSSVFLLTQVVADKVRRERLCVCVCVWEGERQRYVHTDPTRNIKPLSCS